MWRSVRAGRYLNAGEPAYEISLKRCRAVATLTLKPYFGMVGESSALCDFSCSTFGNGHG